MQRSDSDFATARLKKEQAMAKMRQLQTEMLEGKLLNAAEVRACWSAAMVAPRDRALGMADRIASRGALTASLPPIGLPPLASWKWRKERVALGGPPLRRPTVVA
jgi:hypothetical protein